MVLDWIHLPIHVGVAPVAIRPPVPVDHRVFCACLCLEVASGEAQTPNQHTICMLAPALKFENSQHLLSALVSDDFELLLQSRLTLCD